MNKKINVDHLFKFQLNEISFSERFGRTIACILVADELKNTFELQSIVDQLVPAGCTYFMTWGKAADRLHEALDQILERRGEIFLNAVTTSHQQESASEVAWFLLNATFPGESDLSIGFGYDAQAGSTAKLLSAIYSEMNSARNE